jgi:hypothetical protein
MTTHASQSINGSLDTAVAGSTLNGLTNGSLALGAAINNAPTDGSTISYDLGDISITLSSAVTTGSGTPNLVVYIIPEVDGANYPSATAATVSPNLGYTFQFPASQAQTTLVCMNIPIPPYNFKVALVNNLGATLPATNSSTCQMQRKTVAFW